MVFLSAMLIAAIAANVAISSDDNPAFTDPTKAGADFQIQGEYAGFVDADGDRWGTQVIALGDGKFHAVGYRGGLPGKAWKRGDERIEVDGQIAEGTAVFEGDEFVLRIKDGVMKVESPYGEFYGELKKVERKSPTLGKKPPAGAVVLFDGTSVDALNNGKIIEDNLLAATSVETKQKFGDHTLHIEFRTPYMPESRGQGRGNSGVYVQSRYELQILDSFGLEGRDNECGGIYSISEPLVNMCYPPLSWQTFDIDFTSAKYDDSGNKTQNARVTIRHNGVVIHDDLELPHGTPGRNEEGPGPDALFLQDHGNPVAFRNIWVVEK
jgi:hypothetical protein